MAAVRRFLFLYRLLRTYGNGRAQAAWKALGSLRGRRCYVYPCRWRWGPKGCS